MHACDQIFLVLPMKISTRLLLGFASSSARSRATSCASRASSRPLPYVVARKTGARKMAAEVGQDNSWFPLRENSQETAAPFPAPDSPAPAAPSAAPDSPAPAASSAAPDSQASTAPSPAPECPTPAAGAAPVGAAAAGGDVQRQDGEWFRVSDSVKLALHRGDITKWCVDGTTDAIVNAANSRMLGGGGVDGAIHRKAGPQLREACREVSEVSRGVRCPVGEARITPGFDLPVSRVIHTVGPVYYEYHNPEGLLGNAYRNSLTAAIENGIKYIAFPAISCGVYSYPPGEAATVSLSVIKEASNGLQEVHFVLFEQETYSAWMEEGSKQFQKI